ncbi:MAG: TolC family protein, partial [Novosphingobium sp.]
MSQYPSGLWAIALVIALGPDHAHASSEYGGIPQSVLHIPVSEGVAAPSAEFPDGTPEDYARGELPPAVSDFDEALARSYWTNPTLLAARSRLRSVDNRLPQARAAYGPKLGFETGYAYVRDQVEQSTGGHRTLSGWTSTASAILTQPVYSFGRNTAAERTALAEIAFEKAKLRSTETQTLLAAVSAFAGLIRDREAVRITADNLALLEREYNDNKLRFAQREVTSSDVHQVETRVEEGRARLFSAKRIDAASAGLFLATIGAPAADHLGSPRPLPIPITSLEAAHAWADQHNPVLRAAYAREKISRASRDAARANLLPRIDIRGSADY